MFLLKHWLSVNWWFFHVVEFPAVLLNTSTGEIESEFHAYVQPQEHPILSEFCMELTGIKQVCPPFLLFSLPQPPNNKQAGMMQILKSRSQFQKIKAMYHLELGLFSVRRNNVPSRSPLESLKIRKNSVVKMNIKSILWKLNTSNFWWSGLFFCAILDW